MIKRRGRVRHRLKTYTGFLFLIFGQIGFVNQAKYLRLRGVLLHRFDARSEVGEVLLHLLTLEIEHIDEHFNIEKNVLSLIGEIALHETVLSDRSKKR